ncbi:MAG: hypothetical protein V7K48_17690 [Nostoc sp.]|uniref:hypothetical protein n=1 Tax=Nostoc sp. TaxID=1180 RepID=UPI002FFA986F
MSQSSLNRRLIQIFGILFGVSVAVWALRGFGILTFIPGGIIWLLLLGAIAIGLISYAQRRWWRI